MANWKTHMGVCVILVKLTACDLIQLWRDAILLSALRWRDGPFTKTSVDRFLPSLQRGDGFVSVMDDEDMILQPLINSYDFKQVVRVLYLLHQLLHLVLMKNKLTPRENL